MDADDGYSEDFGSPSEPVSRKTLASQPVARRPRRTTLAVGSPGPLSHVGLNATAQSFPMNSWSRRERVGATLSVMGSNDDSILCTRVHPQMEKPSFIKALSVDTAELPEWHGFDFEDKSLLMAAIANLFDDNMARPFPFGRLGGQGRLTKSPPLHASPSHAWFRPVFERTVAYPLQYISRCFGALFGRTNKPVVPV